VTGLIRSFISNIVFANVLLLIILVAGFLSVTSMVRESMPEFSIDVILIEVGFPGADPVEVEEGVSKRIEAAIDGLQGIKEYHTSSREGLATVEIEVAENAVAEEVRDRIQNAVDAIDTFPVDVRRPSYTVLMDTEEVIDLALWGDLDERQLKEWAQEVRDELQRLPQVSLVHVGDTRTYEINIEIAQEKLIEYGLSIADVAAAVQQGSLNLSSGAIRTEGQEIRIRAVGRRYTGPDFASIVVKATDTGKRITLDQIAHIDDGFGDDPAYSTFNGEPCVLLWVEKAPGDDSLAISNEVRRYAEEKQRSLPPGVHITPCFDNSDFVRGQINLLLRNGVMGLLLVVVILWLFLNSRLSFWIAMGIPISLCGSFIILAIFDATLNQISLISFIVVLGIVVDDAIVVGEAIFVHRRNGEPPLEAAVAGVREVGMPVLAAVMTTIVAFLPLAFVPGIMGQIMVIMPVVVVSALLISLVECLFLLPAHLSHLPDVSAPTAANHSWRARFQRYHEAPSLWLAAFIERVYTPVVRQAVERRYLTIAVSLSVMLITAGVVGGGFVRVVFWPPVDGTNLRAMVEFPPGTPAEVTRDAVQQTREAFERIAQRTETKSGKDLIQNFYTRVFQSQPHMGRLVLEMPRPSERGVHSQVLAAAWEKEVGVIPGAVAQSFTEDQVGMGGPPIDIWLQGKEMEPLLAAAAELKDKLRNYDGVFQIGDDFRPGKAELLVRLKPEASALGITLQDLARQLHGGYYGEEALRLQRGPDDVRVRVRFPESERQTVTGLNDMRIRTTDGHEVPFLSVAEVTLQQGYASIQGSNGLRRIAVTAYADVN
jgi:multidrug efflux pump subunit AcrB